MTLKSMTTQQEEHLQSLLDKAEVAYARDQAARLEATEEKIFAYVNGLLAEKNAENARLQSRVAQFEADKAALEDAVLPPSVVEAVLYCREMLSGGGFHHDQRKADEWEFRKDKLYVAAAKFVPEPAPMETPSERAESEG